MTARGREHEARALLAESCRTLEQARRLLSQRDTDAAEIRGQVVAAWKVAYEAEERLIERLDMRERLRAAKSSEVASA
jgi:hypothetical protein